MDEKRKYQPIWERVLANAKQGKLDVVTIHVKNLTHEQFCTIRKGFYNEKDLDLENRLDWRADVRRGSGDKADLIHFAVYPRDVTKRF